uniref:Uncharacterized protein n=1 Tax=Cyanistes caeruleus TaxID=156563 RepID=A0A8C0V644_CYACU
MKVRGSCSSGELSWHRNFGNLSSGSSGVERGVGEGSSRSCLLFPSRPAGLSLPRFSQGSEAGKDPTDALCIAIFTPEHICFLSLDPFFPFNALGSAGVVNVSCFEGSSDTSSDTSEDSDSPSCPQGPGSEGIHYTSLVFPGKGHEPGSAQDYKNVKSGMDYVNVDPKKRKIHFCPFSSPEGSKGMEYTEVKP